MPGRLQQRRRRSREPVVAWLRLEVASCFSSCHASRDNAYFGWLILWTSVGCLNCMRSQRHRGSSQYCWFFPARPRIVIPGLRFPASGLLSVPYRRAINCLTQPNTSDFLSAGRYRLQISQKSNRRAPVERPASNCAQLQFLGGVVMRSFRQSPWVVRFRILKVVSCRGSTTRSIFSAGLLKEQNC